MGHRDHDRGSGALGPSHYVRSGRPHDTIRAEQYADGPTADISEIALNALAQLSPRDPDPAVVASAIAKVVEMPSGQRPLRILFDPDEDGAAVVDAVVDRTPRNCFSASDWRIFSNRLSSDDAFLVDRPRSKFPKVMTIPESDKHPKSPKASSVER
jgi:hypothetical protein